MSALVSHERFVAARERRQRAIAELRLPSVEPPGDPAVIPDLARPIYCEAVAAEMTTGFGETESGPAHRLLLPDRDV